MLCNMLFSTLCNMLYGLAIQHCYIVMLYIQLLCYIGCYITNVIQLVIQSAMQPVSKNIQYDIQLDIKYMLCYNLYNMYICHIYLLYSMVYNRLYNTKFQSLLVLVQAEPLRIGRHARTHQAYGLDINVIPLFKHPTAKEMICQFI